MELGLHSVARSRCKLKRRSSGWRQVNLIDQFATSCARGKSGAALIHCCRCTVGNLLMFLGPRLWSWPLSSATKYFARGFCKRERENQPSMRSSEYESSGSTTGARSFVVAAAAGKIRLLSASAQSLSRRWQSELSGRGQELLMLMRRRQRGCG